MQKKHRRKEKNQAEQVESIIRDRRGKKLACLGFLNIHIESNESKGNIFKSAARITEKPHFKHAQKSFETS